MLLSDTSFPRQLPDGVTVTVGGDFEPTPALTPLVTTEQASAVPAPAPVDGAVGRFVNGQFVPDAPAPTTGTSSRTVTVTSGGQTFIAQLKTTVSFQWTLDVFRVIGDGKSVDRETLMTLDEYIENAIINYPELRAWARKIDEFSGDDWSTIFQQVLNKMMADDGGKAAAAS